MWSRIGDTWLYQGAPTPWSMPGRLKVREISSGLTADPSPEAIDEQFNEGNHDHQDDTGPDSK